jgi:hypothetical protein
MTMSIVIHSKVTGVARITPLILLASARALVRRFAAAVVVRWQVRRAEAALARGGGTMMRDLCIAAGGVESAVRHGRR